MDLIDEFPMFKFSLMGVANIFDNIVRFVEDEVISSSIEEWYEQSKVNDLVKKSLQEQYNEIRELHPNWKIRINKKNLQRQYGKGPKWRMLCSHYSLKEICKKCGGNAICIHDKQKRFCKKCDGSVFCFHGKQKKYCKECGGSAYCFHGKEKKNCKQCRGSQICAHDKLKRYCKECDGSAYCLHDRKKTSCKECGGSQICIHGKHKQGCKECGGSQICIHDKYKTACKECGGSAYCNHGKLKARCRDCGGSAFCAHDKLKIYCQECNGACLCIKCKCKVKKVGDFCTTCDPHYVPTSNGISKVGCKWIDQLQIKIGRSIQHGHYANESCTRCEYKPTCTGPVDGYDKETNTIYEFLGDQFHGHVNLWEKERNHLGLSYEYMYWRTKDKFDTLIQNGYTVIYIWESDFKKQKALDDAMTYSYRYEGVLYPEPIDE